MPKRTDLHGLYAITDGPREDLIDACTHVLEGGAALLQYRDKTKETLRRFAEARSLVALCNAHGVPLIINDDIELAIAVGAAGVHLGQDDINIGAARERTGSNMIIGASCYDSLGRARTMAAAGADYLAFGAFYPSPTKPHACRASPDLLKEARVLGVPLVAIGGITAENGMSLIESGADCLAAISAVFGAPDPRSAARGLSDLFVGRRQELHHP